MRTLKQLDNALKALEKKFLELESENNRLRNLKTPDFGLGDWRSINDVADTLRCSTSQVRKMCREKTLLAKKQGTKWVISANGLNDYLLYGSIN